MKSLFRMTAWTLLSSVFALAVSQLSLDPVHAQRRPTGSQADSQGSIVATTVAYVGQFYPLWFTYYQSLFGTPNRLIGPIRISPLYHAVVAINDDTVYASTFLDLTAQPVIVTVPGTTLIYSVLTLDPYGTVFESGIGPQPTDITYALTGPEFTGTLPAGVTRIALPLDFMTLIFRVDKFSPAPDSVDQRAEADLYRLSLRLQTLSDYLNDPSGGAPSIAPEAEFAVPFKTTADELIAKDAIAFLKQLQTAVASPNTPPLSPAAQALSNRFDDLFGSGEFGPPSGDTGVQRAQFIAGARAAHTLIMDRYLTHRGPTNWIHFTNIGAWGDQVIERASITGFCQYCNDIRTAAYYHTFWDGQGALLNGSHPPGYVLTFPAGQLPQVERFWSLTAYTPQAIELVDNAQNKYVIASYTPELQSNADGSLSVYLATELPQGVPEANWLPVPLGPFNIMLRIYGVVPNSNIANNTYVPPDIETLDPAAR